MIEYLGEVLRKRRGLPTLELPVRIPIAAQEGHGVPLAQMERERMEREHVRAQLERKKQEPALVPEPEGQWSV